MTLAEFAATHGVRVSSLRDFLKTAGLPRRCCEPQHELSDDMQRRLLPHLARLRAGGDPPAAVPVE